MKRIALIAVACLGMFAAVAYAKDRIHGDFIYDSLSTDTLPINLMFLQTRTAIVAGDYQGVAKVTAVPAAPSSGIRRFDLSGVGPANEDPDGNVFTECGQFVTTYPDAGYVTVAVDGGTALRCMRQYGSVTETDGGATYTFDKQFNSVPVCFATSTAAVAHAQNVNTPTYTTINVAGTVNTNDVVNVSCTGYR